LSNGATEPQCASAIKTASIQSPLVTTNIPTNF